MTGTSVVGLLRQRVEEAIRTDSNNPLADLGVVGERAMKIARALGIKVNPSSTTMSQLHPEIVHVMGLLEDVQEGIEHMPTELLARQLAVMKEASNTLSAVMVALENGPTMSPDQAKVLLGKDFIGPEAYGGIWDGLSVNRIAPLPKAFTLEGYKAPMLVYVPAQLGGKDLTLNEFLARANQHCRAACRDSIFPGSHWFGLEEFANGVPAEARLDGGEWVLVEKPAQIAPGAFLPVQSTSVSPRGLVVALGMHSLLNPKALLLGRYWTNESTPSGAQLVVESSARGIRLMAGSLKEGIRSAVSSVPRIPRGVLPDMP